MPSISDIEPLILIPKNPYAKRWDTEFVIGIFSKPIERLDRSAKFPLLLLIRKRPLKGPKGRGKCARTACLPRVAGAWEDLLVEGSKLRRMAGKHVAGWHRQLGHLGRGKLRERALETWNARHRHPGCGARKKCTMEGRGMVARVCPILACRVVSGAPSIGTG